MNSFNLTAIGQLARDPEMLSKDDTLYTRFCLIATDYAARTARERSATWSPASGSSPLVPWEKPSR